MTTQDKRRKQFFEDVQKHGFTKFTPPKKRNYHKPRIHEDDGYCETCDGTPFTGHSQNCTVFLHHEECTAKHNTESGTHKGKAKGKTKHETQQAMNT